jgi:hypothetical protein
MTPLNYDSNNGHQMVEELTLEFHAERTIKHLANLLLGIEPPSSEADKKFLDNMTKACKEKEDASTEL